MHENQSQTESILDIVAAVDKGTALLTEFQRDFRWDMSQTYDLFDSLIREIFIGTIIYGKPGFGMALRKIDTRPRKGKGSRTALQVVKYGDKEMAMKCQTQNLRIILDGQQRITSVYRALTGADAVYAILRWDMQTEGLIAGALEEIVADVAGEESAEAVSVRLDHAYRDAKENLDDADKDVLFAETAFAKGLDVGDPKRKGYAKAYRHTIKKLTDLYKKQKLVAFYLLDMTMEKFCLFFERSNSRGIQLNFTDILAAKLYPTFNLRLKIEEFEDHHGQILNREMIVRAIAYMSAVANKRPIVIDKKAILENLMPEDFLTHWDQACSLYKDCLDYLVKQHFVVKRTWLPSENMIVPLMVFLGHVKGFDRIDEGQRLFLEFWFWSSVFANKYSMSSNEVIIADCQALAQVAQGKRIERRDYFAKLRSQVTEYDDLYSYTKRTSAIYRGVLNLIGYAHDGLRDWKSTQKIDADKDFDDHHIFPRGYIASDTKFDVGRDEAGALVDSVVNRTLIPKNLNIKIGKQSPQAYLSDLRRQNADLAVSLDGHLIPRELLDDKSKSLAFGEFLEARARSIFGFIEQYAIEPLPEMEARYAASLEAGDTPIGAEKLAKGLRTPEKAFEIPILAALVKLGGKAPMQQVLDVVGEAIKANLRDVDFQFLKSDAKRPRWQNTAQWCRNTMVGAGLLVKGGQHGIWEITELGRKVVKKK